MDEAVIKFYRKLLSTRFEYAGSFEHASIFLDTADEKLSICGTASDFMQLSVNIIDDKIDDIKYKCICDPTANVAVEIMCTLVKGKTLDEVARLTEETLAGSLGSNGEDFRKKARALLEFLNMGIRRYRERV